MSAEQDVAVRVATGAMAILTRLLVYMAESIAIGPPVAYAVRPRRICCPVLDARNGPAPGLADSCATARSAMPCSTVRYTLEHGGLSGYIDDLSLFAPSISCAASCVAKRTSLANVFHALPCTTACKRCVRSKSVARTQQRGACTAKFVLSPHQVSSSLAVAACAIGMHAA